MLGILAGAIRPYLLTVAKWALIALAVAGVLLGVRNAGRQAERVDNLERALEAVRRRRDVEADVDRLRDGDALAELRRDWSRGD